MNCAGNRSGISSNDVEKVKENAKNQLAYSSQIKRPHLQLSTFYTNQSLPAKFVEKEANIENTAVSHNYGNWGNSYNDDNTTDETSLLFKAKYQLNHPRGFRLLQNESVIERHLHNYFRLPPAPCRALQAEREYIRHAMRVIDAREVAARENRRTCHNHYYSKLNHIAKNNEQFYTSELAAATAATEEGQHYNKHESNNSNGPHTLNKALLMSSTKEFAPEDVIEANLQDLELESAIADDLMQFGNLRSLDVSENKLTLCDVSALPALQTLNMTCNEITSMEELHSLMSHELFQSNGIEENNKEKTKYEECQEYCLKQELELPMSSSRSLHELKRVHHTSQQIECMPFAQLTSLNMSYNHIPAHHIILFALLPSLECLHLSGNELRVLPSDLSQFTQLKQIILQYNSFVTEMHSSICSDTMNLHKNEYEEIEQETEAMTSYYNNNNNSSRVVPCTSNVFASLSTAPALIIVDVSHNKLSAIPPFHVAEKDCKCEHNEHSNISNGSSSSIINKNNKYITSTWYCFPKLVHIDLSYNCFSEPTSILALAHLHQTLRVIKVHHNPLCHSSTKTNMTRALFDNVIVNEYYSPPFHAGTGTNSSLAQMESKEECTCENDENKDEDDDEDSLLWHGDEWDQLLPTHELNKEKSMMTHSQNMANISAAAAAAAAACYSQRASSATSSHNTDFAITHVNNKNDSQSNNNHHDNINSNYCEEEKNSEQVCLNEWGEDVNEEYQRLSPYKEELEEQQEQQEEYLEENNEVCETALHDHLPSCINVTTTTTTASAAAAQTTNTVPNNIYTMYKTADAYWHAFQIRLVFDDNHYCTPPLLCELYSTHPLSSYSHLESSAATITTNTDGCDETRHAMRRLVTIPPYNEFMDIYRLVRCVPPTKPKNNSRWRRRTIPGTKMPKSYKTQLDLSSEQNLEEYTEVERQYSLLESAQPQGQPSAICTSQTTSAAVEVNNKVQKDDNGFFITGVDQTATFASHHATPHNSIIIADRYKEPLTSTEHTLPLIRKSVISPSTMNVQHAMRELRMLLRKPLPPLPHTHKTRV